MRRRRRPIAAAAVIAAAFAAGPATAQAPPTHYGWAQRVAAAKQFADGRMGRISFALVDESGRLHGSHPDRIHNSASVVKVMFMVAFLRQPGVRHDSLTSGERHLLRPMITHSDDAAANAVFVGVGERALYALADDAGMDHFTTQPVWGLSEITAREQARFMYRVERFIPRRHRAYAMRLLSSIIGRQRWGIPPVAPSGWKLYFKGGWSGRPHWRVNQVMLPRRPPRRFSIAILTREQPSKVYGEHSIEAV